MDENLNSEEKKILDELRGYAGGNAPSQARTPPKARAQPSQNRVDAAWSEFFRSKAFKLGFVFACVIPLALAFIAACLAAAGLLVGLKSISDLLTLYP